MLSLIKADVATTGKPHLRNGTPSRLLNFRALSTLLAKRKYTLYEPGHRSGAWAKYRLNCGQEFVIGDYMPSTKSLDAIIVGYYNGDDLIYVARVRRGLVPAHGGGYWNGYVHSSRNNASSLIYQRSGNRVGGEGLTAEDMKSCVWVRPELVAQIEFLEWTDGDHLRHAKFVGLREDKDPRRVAKEHAGEA